MSRGEAASKQKLWSLSGARKHDGSRYHLIVKDMMPGTLVQQVQEWRVEIPRNMQNLFSFLSSLAMDCD